MDAKSLSKVVLLGGSMIAGSLEGAFALTWKCSLDEEHDEVEVCRSTLDRFCDKCKVVHLGWQVCPKTVFRIPSEDCKYAILPFGVPDDKIIELQVQYGYDEDGKKINSVNSFPGIKNKAEATRLSHCVHALVEKYLPKKVEDKKEGDGNLGFGAEDMDNPVRGKTLVLGKGKEKSENQTEEDLKADYRNLGCLQFGKGWLKRFDKEQLAQEEIEKKRGRGALGRKRGKIILDEGDDWGRSSESEQTEKKVMKKKK